MSDAEVNYDPGADALARTDGRRVRADATDHGRPDLRDVRRARRPGAEVPARQTAQTVERRFGPVHPLTFDAINSLAITLRGIGQRDVARELLTDLVNRARAHREVTHPKGEGRYFANLAMVLREQGRDADANAAARGGCGRGCRATDRPAAVDQLPPRPRRPAPPGGQAGGGRRRAEGVDRRRPSRVSAPPTPPPCSAPSSSARSTSSSRGGTRSSRSARNCSPPSPPVRARRTSPRSNRASRPPRRHFAPDAHRRPGRRLTRSSPS